MSRVLITGAAGGLGSALADAFERQGDRVLRTDVAGGDLMLDVTSEEDWAAVVGHVRREWGGLDVLVNNAGVVGGGRIEVCTIDEWRWITDINLFGVVRGTAAFTPMFKDQGAGRIVNVASLAGLVHPAGMASYNAVKAAVVALTETTAHELAPFGVRACVVCPSFFRTGLMSSLRATDKEVADIFIGLLERSPITAEEIAVAVLAGLARDEELILPDEPARSSYALKYSDRAAYDDVMRTGAASVAQIPLPSRPTTVG
ncbi:MAG: SDR family NAD(P)-dependent oxidoreductase [Candidatus Nanopelagicales bacterium]